MVKVKASISIDEKVDLTGKADTLPHQLVVCISDDGDDKLSKIISEISTLKRIIKAMDGSLEANTSCDETNFVLTVPCREVL